MNPVKQIIYSKTINLVDYCEKFSTTDIVVTPVRQEIEVILFTIYAEIRASVNP